MTFSQKLDAYEVALAIFMMALIISISAIVIALWPSPKNKNHVPQEATKQIGAACTSDAAPCLELADNDGKPLRPAIKFNDFRFGPQGCIYYLAPSDSKWHERCGGYTLLWIGPGHPPGREGKI